MPDFPECPHRVDTNEIEDNMRGLIKTRIKPKAQEDISHACELLFDECLDKLDRVRSVIRQMKEGICK